MNIKFDQLNAWDRMFREARERGMRAYERGDRRDSNPFQGTSPRESAEWLGGWDDAAALDEERRKPIDF